MNRKVRCYLSRLYSSAFGYFCTILSLKFLVPTAIEGLPSDGNVISQFKICRTFLPGKPKPSLVVTALLLMISLLLFLRTETSTIDKKAIWLKGKGWNAIVLEQTPCHEILLPGEFYEITNNQEQAEFYYSETKEFIVSEEQRTNLDALSFLNTDSQSQCNRVPNPNFLQQI